MSENSYWIAFGDIHDDLSRLDDITELPGAAGVIVTGDITFAGGIRQAEKALGAIAGKTPALLAQIGNMDKAEITGWLEEKGWNLHRRAKILCPGVIAFGAGCSSFTPFNTPSEHPEETLLEWMEEAYEEALRLARESAFSETRLAFVSHSPPLASNCDRLGDGTPVGSAAVREFIEKRQPDLCLCGHIHESRAEDHIGRTHVINPGALVAGGYVLLRLQSGPQGPQLSAELKTV